MQSVQTFLSKKERAYTGSELRPHFLLTEFGVRGSALAAFCGPCHVDTEHLVDWEDRIAQDRIEAKTMVHFIGEFFGSGLKETVVRQRLLMATMMQQVNEDLRKAGRHERGQDGSAGIYAERRGDDIFVLGRKLSVSIVTASPVSMLLHAGINIDPAGAPVPAVGLTELGLDPSAAAREEWAGRILGAFAEEWESIEWACAKVRPVM